MKKVKALTEKVRVCFLATTDGTRPAVRPMAGCLWVGGEFWIATRTRSAKVADLRRKPRAEVCCMDKNYTHVRIAGTCKIETSVADKTKMLRALPWLKRRLGEPGDPGWVILRLTPKSIRLMDMKTMNYKDVKPPRRK